MIFTLSQQKGSPEIFFGVWVTGSMLYLKLLLKIEPGFCCLICPEELNVTFAIQMLSHTDHGMLYRFNWCI